MAHVLVIAEFPDPTDYRFSNIKSMKLMGLVYDKDQNGWSQQKTLGTRKIQAQNAYLIDEQNYTSTQQSIPVSSYFKTGNRCREQKNTNGLTRDEGAWMRQVSSNNYKTSIFIIQYPRHRIYSYAIWFHDHTMPASHTYCIGYAGKYVPHVIWSRRLFLKHNNPIQYLNMKSTSDKYQSYMHEFRQEYGKVHGIWENRFCSFAHNKF